MSLLGKVFSSIGGIVKKVLPSAVSMIPGVGTIGGAILGGVVSAGMSGGGGGGGRGGLPALPGGAAGRGLPALAKSGGKIISKVAPVAAAAALAYDAYGNVIGVHKKRRRRKGISAHDLTSFKRVARLIDKFAAPVHHLRKSSFKKGHA